MEGGDIFYGLVLSDFIKKFETRERCKEAGGGRRNVVE